MSLPAGLALVPPASSPASMTGSSLHSQQLYTIASEPSSAGHSSTSTLGSLTSSTPRSPMSPMGLESMAMAMTAPCSGASSRLPTSRIPRPHDRRRRSWCRGAWYGDQHRGLRELQDLNDTLVVPASDLSASGHGHDLDGDETFNHSHGPPRAAATPSPGPLQSTKSQLPCCDQWKVTAGYSIKLPDGYEARKRALLKVIREKKISLEALTALHEFIYPLFNSVCSAGQENDGNRLQLPIEFVLPLIALRDDGNLASVTVLTQPLAQIKYICRTATFFEAKRCIANFDANLLDERRHIQKQPVHSRKRRKRREKKRAEVENYAPSERTQRVVLERASSPLQAAGLATEDLPSKAGAYGVKHEDFAYAKRTWNLQELIDMGFELIEWDGRAPRPLIDRAGRRFADAARKARELMEREREGAQFDKSETNHRRGQFPAFASGISYGGAQHAPIRLVNGDTDTRGEMLRRFLDDANFCRLACYANTLAASFALWFPNLYKYYCKYMETLYKARPTLYANFNGSIFPCATFNLGPQVCTFRHRDVHNLAFGLCAFTALGTFDPKGGHIILGDAKIVIEFPPGSTVLIPSTAVARSNLPVQPFERRTSFTRWDLPMGRSGLPNLEELQKADKEEFQRQREALSHR
ncbi:hypothetical protein HGRIS_001143 [Hohenbuehelia grisea]|uniref:Mono(ADP-ribosyl)transferase n=1 Tax=Hohenbuehelia grisea TaxID=104357 RepID=A0ABR3JND7_9AGAR